MADVVIIGSGFSGHTAAIYLAENLSNENTLTVISDNDKFVYSPLLADVASGRLNANKIIISLHKIYGKFEKINFVNSKVIAIFPDDNRIEITGNNDKNIINYDFLIIATGNVPSFSSTKGFSTNGESLASIINFNEIEKTKRGVQVLIDRLKRGEKKKIIIGSGHPNSSFHNGALNFAINLHYRLIEEKVRENAEIVYFSNETELGDFGLFNPQVKIKGKISPVNFFLKNILDENGIKYSVGNAVKEVSQNQIYYEKSNGDFIDDKFDLAILIPKMLGTEIKIYDKNRNYISDKIFNGDKHILVDTFYNLDHKDFLNNPELLPSKYWNRNYKNIFAGGSVFAMPTTISEPYITKNGTVISPKSFIGTSASSSIGRLIAKNILQFINEGKMTHSLRLSEILSVFTIQLGGKGLFSEAFFLSVYPVFPDLNKYPNSNGRDLFVSSLEIGLSAHWMRKIINSSYIYKFKTKPGWRIIPE